MDTENKPIIRNANIPLLITGVIAFAIACIFTAVTYPLMYDINETAARIIILLPPVFCAIFSLILYKYGSSAITRELSALIFAVGIAASVLLFKSFCGDNDMFHYSYGAIPYLIPLAALGAMAIFDCIVPFFLYGALVIEICISAFTSEYTVLSYPASLIALIPVFIYTITKSGTNDYRKYLTRVLIPAAILLTFFAAIGLWVIVLVAVAVIVAAIFVFRKYKIEKADFTIGIKRTLTAAAGFAIILPVILGIQLNYTFHLDTIRRQSFQAMYEIEIIEIRKNMVSVILKSEDPNGQNTYAGEKYAVLKPIDIKNNKYSIERYSDTAYSRKLVFILADYLNGKPLSTSIRYSDREYAEKFIGAYYSDDWDSAYVNVSVDNEGDPDIHFWSFEITGNDALEDLFQEDY